MLLVALLLLLAAVGLLATSFVLSETWWAWASVAVSGLAAAVLVARWWRARRRRAAASGRHRRARPTAIPMAVAEAGGAPVDGASLDGTEPAEEETDAADLLVVCELEDEVLVVDEHPRYHLMGCGWLGSRAVEPLPASEARSLGFTPCAQCGPDAELAGRRRSRSG